MVYGLSQYKTDGFNRFDATFVALLAVCFLVRKLVSWSFQNKYVRSKQTPLHAICALYIDSSRDPHPVFSPLWNHHEDDYTCWGPSTTPNRRTPFVSCGLPMVRANESLFLAARLRYLKCRHHEEWKTTKQLTWESKLPVAFQIII